MTRKQAELLEFLKRHASEYQHSPSYDEMRVAVGLSSKSGVHRLLEGLEARGLVERDGGRARSVRLVRADAPPDNVVQLNPSNASRFARYLDAITRHHVALFGADPSPVETKAYQHAALVAMASMNDREAATAARRHCTVIQNAAMGWAW